MAWQTRPWTTRAVARETPGPGIVTTRPCVGRNSHRVSSGIPANRIKAKVTVIGIVPAYESRGRRGGGASAWNDSAVAARASGSADRYRGVGVDGDVDGSIALIGKAPFLVSVLDLRGPRSTGALGAVLDLDDAKRGSGNGEGLVASAQAGSGNRFAGLDHRCHTNGLPRIVDDGIDVVVGESIARRKQAPSYDDSRDETTARVSPHNKGSLTLGFFTKPIEHLCDKTSYNRRRVVEVSRGLLGFGPRRLAPGGRTGRTQSRAHESAGAMLQAPHIAA